MEGLGGVVGMVPVTRILGDPGDDILGFEVTMVLDIIGPEMWQNY